MTQREGVGGASSEAGHALREQEELWGEVLGLAASAGAALRAAVEATGNGRADLIDSVRRGEPEIDRREVRIELECLRLLARYGLAATDLRRVVVSLRAIRDLEGLADLAEKLARRAGKIAADPASARFLPRLNALAAGALAVVDDGLEALRGEDAGLARRVIASDRGVDRARGELAAVLKQALRDDPSRLNTWLRMLNSARNLERAADYATNIAEGVVYLKEAVLTRRSDVLD